MLKKGKTGFNLVIFQNTLVAPDFLEILEGTRVLERWGKPRIGSR